MNIEIDTKEKVIKLVKDVTVEELSYFLLENPLPQLKDYKIKVSKEIVHVPYYVTSPEPNPNPTPYLPWPWDGPQCRTDSGDYVFDSTTSI